MTLSLPLSTLFPYTTLFRSSRPAATSSTSMFSPAPSTKVMDSVIGGQRELADLWRHWLTPDGEPSPCPRSEEHTSELQSRGHLVCRLLLEKKNKQSATD